MFVKKIGGNWHKIDIWHRESCIVAYKSGGLVFVSLDTYEEIRYIPFYGFIDFQINDNILFVLDNQDQVFNLVNLNANLKPTENQFFIQKDNIDFTGYNVIEEVRAFDYSDELLICAYKQGGIDFFNRQTCEKIGHFQFPNYNFIDGIVLFNNKIYIADVFGLRILDITDINHPELNDNYIFRSWPKDAAVDDKYLYVADVLGIKIFDKTDHFKMAGKFETNQNRVAKVLVKGQYAYLACEARGLRIVNIEDVKNPFLVSGMLMAHGAWDINLYNNEIYIAAYTNGLIKVNQTQVKQLETKAKYNGHKEIIGVWSDNKAVYAACSYEGFCILDHDLRLIQRIDIDAGRCWTIITYENNLFAACGKAGVLVYDTTDVLYPKIITVIETKEARDLVLRDNRLYVADGRNGVEIIDVIDIRKPKHFRNIPSAAFTRGVMVDGSFIYKTDGDGGVEVYE